MKKTKTGRGKVSDYLVSFGLTFFVAFSGSFVTAPGIPNWYRGLNKPFFNPPNWIFGPVWTALFILMAYAWVRVLALSGGKKKRSDASVVFIVQLFFNFLWSFLFFGLARPLAAFADIIILWVLIALTIRRFYSLDRLAGYLLIPYIAWVSFAAVLNLAIVILNP